MTRRILASSSMRSRFVWRRPAVSAMTTSTPRAEAASRASNTTAPGSAPGPDRLAGGQLAAPARGRDESGRQRRSDVGGDERLLRRVPGGLIDRAACQQAAQSPHEAAPRRPDGGLEPGHGIGYDATRTES